MTGHIDDVWTLNQAQQRLAHHQELTGAAIKSLGKVTSDPFEFDLPLPFVECLHLLDTKWIGQQKKTQAVKMLDLVSLYQQAVATVSSRNLVSSI